MSVHLGACPPPHYKKLATLYTVASFRSPEEWPNEDGRFRPPPPPPLATRNRRHWLYVIVVFRLMDQLPGLDTTAWAPSVWDVFFSRSAGANRPPQLPDEQAGFCRGRSTVLQVVKLSNGIEVSVERGHKVGAILVDLTAVFDHWRKSASGFYLGGCGIVQWMDPPPPPPRWIEILADLRPCLRYCVATGPDPEISLNHLQHPRH